MEKRKCMYFEMSTPYGIAYMFMLMRESDQKQTIHTTHNTSEIELVPFTTTQVYLTESTIGSINSDDYDT